MIGDHRVDLKLDVTHLATLGSLTLTPWSIVGAVLAAGTVTSSVLMAGVLDGDLECITAFHLRSVPDEGKVNSTPDLTWCHLVPPSLVR